MYYSWDLAWIGWVVGGYIFIYAKYFVASRKTWKCFLLKIIFGSGSNYCNTFQIS